MEKEALLAKINPPLYRVEQTEQFGQNVNWVLADYMLVKANPYVLGSNSVDFSVSFVQYLTDEDTTSIKTIHRDRVSLSGEEIEDWGTDDTTIFSSIADHFGIEIVSTKKVILDINNFF